MGDDGRLRASVVAPSTYYLADPAGTGLVERVLGEGIAAVCAQAGVAPGEVDFAFCALPTYGESSEDLAALDAAPRSALGHDRYRCDNDTVAGWAGSLGAADGINVVSGTGSITYGERRGARARVGGWGEMFGDEGSGYWIGVRGLHAFARRSDGRLPAGPLLGLLREHLGLAADLDLVTLVLNRWGSSRQQVAALAPVVVAAARAGDDEAARVLQDAGAELAVLVDTTRRRLGFRDDETVPVSWSGGVFGSPEVREAFTRRLGALHGGYDLRQPLYPPVVGAALYAARLAGTPLEEGALARLRADLASSGA